MVQPSSSTPRRALVVLSGGQDSTTCLFWALKHFDEVHALGFTYGQKHTHEVEIAKAICAEQQVPYEVMDVPLLGQLGSNSLTDTTLEMDTDKPAGGPPNTFVPVATSSSSASPRSTLASAVSSISSRELAKRTSPAIPTAATTSSRASTSRSTSPWTSSFACTRRSCGSTSRTWGMADQLGVLDLIRTRTLTCYNGVVGDGCGHCPACKLRREGLETYLKSKV